MKLKQYESYKPSGSRWIGEVPSHWPIRKLRSLISARNERHHPEFPLLSVARERGVFLRSLTGDDNNHNAIPEDLTNYKVARKGDLVINKMKAWQGSMGIAPCDGLVSPAYFVFKFDFPNRAFGEMLVRSKPYVAHFGQASDGVRIGQWDLSIPRMREIPILIPETDEQAKIVEFLLYFNIHIEQLVQKKKRLISLLNEEKQSIVYNAVTRGFDRDMYFRPSGVEWLGEVPRTWEVRRLRFLVREIGGMTPSKSEASFWNGNIAWVSPKDMKVEELVVTSQRISQAALNQTPIQLIEPPVVLIVVRGMILARSFPVALTAEPVTINQDMKALIPQGNLRSDFLSYLLRGLEKPILHLVQEAGHGTKCLRTEMWRNLQVPFPPSLEEQQDIVNRLKSELTPLNRKLKIVNREIDLIREYRTRLIADVVIGKLDVRNVEPDRIKGFEDELESISSLDRSDVDDVDDVTLLEETEEPAYADD